MQRNRKQSRDEGKTELFSHPGRYILGLHVHRRTSVEPGGVGEHVVRRA